MEFDPPFTGDNLKLWVDSPKPKRPAIVEGFLYEKSCLMLVADGGKGKSTIAVQMAMELSSGSPLFGAFKVTKPQKVFFIQKERPKEEVGERLELMQKSIAWNQHNFLLCDALQGTNLSKEQNWLPVINYIKPFKPDIIFIDPIYAGQPGLSKDEIASSFTSFLTYMQKVIGATHILTHHVPKETIDMKTGKPVEKDNPSYGSVWLNNHVSGSYIMRQGEHGVCFQKFKSNHGNLIEEINLIYDYETMLSKLDRENMPVADKLRMLHTTMKVSKKRLKFKEICQDLGCADSTLRDIFRTPPFDKIFSKHKSIGYATLYEAI